MERQERSCPDCGRPMGPYVHRCESCREVHRKKMREDRYGVFAAGSRSSEDAEIRNKIRGIHALRRRARIIRYAEYACAGLPIPYESRTNCLD